MITVGVTGLLTLVVVWLLVRPHLVGSGQSQAEGNAGEALAALDRRAAMLDQKTRCLQLLKDLELDYQMRKIDEADYQQMRRPLMRELSAILERSPERSSRE